MRISIKQIKERVIGSETCYCSKPCLIDQTHQIAIYIAVFVKGDDGTVGYNTSGISCVVSPQLNGSACGNIADENRTVARGCPRRTSICTVFDGQTKRIGDGDSRRILYCLKGQRSGVGIESGGVFNGPSCGDTARACGPCCHFGGLDESAGRRDVFEPFVNCHFFRNVCGKTLHVVQGRAAVEHVAVCTVGHLGCRQFGCFRQTRASVKHILIDPVDDLGCGKDGRPLFEVLATFEHFHVAIYAAIRVIVCHFVVPPIVHLRGGQFRRTLQCLATSEHIGIARAGNIGRWQQEVLCRMALDGGVGDEFPIGVVTVAGAEKIFEGERICQPDVGGKVGSMNETHDVAIDIHLCRTGDVMVVRSVAVLGIVTAQAHYITSIHIDSDGW